MDFSEYGLPSSEWRAFIQAHPEIGQPGKVNPELTPKQIQEQTNAAREATSAALFESRRLGEVVDITDYKCPTRDESSIYVRRYYPKRTTSSKLPTVIYFHGGGYIFGSLASEKLFCGSISAELGVAVLHICYRHTPDFTHPTAHNDGHDGMTWITSHADLLAVDLENVVVGGLSAGAAVAATVALDASKGALATVCVKGLMLGIPWILHQEAFPFELFAKPEVTSQVQCADSPVISRESIDFFMDLLQVKNVMDPLLNFPLRSKYELKQLPPTAIIVSGRDPLRDGGLLLAKRLEALEVPTKVHVFSGLPHGFRRFSELPSAATFDKVIVESIRWALQSGAEASSHKEWQIEIS